LQIGVGAQSGNVASVLPETFKGIILCCFFKHLLQRKYVQLVPGQIIELFHKPTGINIYIKENWNKR
jgi:hypothetical protein